MEALAPGSVGSDDSHCSHRSMRVAASLGTAGGYEETEHQGNLADLGVEIVVMMLHVVRCMLLLMLVMTVLMMLMVLTVLRQTWWHPPQWSQLAHVVASGWRQGDDSHNLLILLPILIHFAHFGSLLLAHPWQKWKQAIDVFAKLPAQRQLPNEVPALRDVGGIGCG